VRPLQLQPWTPLRPCPLRPAPTSLPPAAPSPGRPLPSCPAPAPPCGPVAVRWVSSSRGMRLQSRDGPLRRWPLRSALAEERGERRRGGGERSARTGATGAGQRVDALPWVVSSVCRYERLLLVTRRSRKKGGDRRASCADADADLAPPPFPLPHPLAPWTEQQAQQHTHTSHVDPSHLGPQHPGPSSLHPLISSLPSPPPPSNVTRPPSHCRPAPRSAARRAMPAAPSPRSAGAARPAASSSPALRTTPTSPRPPRRTWQSTSQSSRSSSPSPRSACACASLFLLVLVAHARPELTLASPPAGSSTRSSTSSTAASPPRATRSYVHSPPRLLLKRDAAR